MSLTTTEILGFAASVKKFMQDNQTTLLSRGLDVTNLIAELDAQAENANVQNGTQEAMKAALKTQTTATEVALQATYESSSTKLDAAVSAIGKTSDLGRQGLKLRSDIRRGPNTPPATPPGP